MKKAQLKIRVEILNIWMVLRLLKNELKMISLIDLKELSKKRLMIKFLNKTVLNLQTENNKLKAESCNIKLVALCLTKVYSS